MIISRKDFADLCGKEVSYINVYISRGKIVTTPDDKGKIDTDNALNKLFKKRCKDAEKKKKEKEKIQQKKKVEKKKVEKIDTGKLYDEVVEKISKEAAKEANDKQNEVSEDVVSWDLRKKIADALKAEQQAEKERLNVEKLMGNLMPVDLVQQIITINIQDIFRTYDQDIVNQASIFCDIMAGGDRTKLAQVIAKLRTHLEHIIQKVEKSAAKEVENVIKEYSQTRSRGEKK